MAQRALWPCMRRWLWNLRMVIAVEGIPCVAQRADTFQMAAWFCPCFLYGRVSQRLDRYPDDETPGMCNGSCWLMCGASVVQLHWLVALFKRGDTRNKFGVRGDGCTDCLVCCISSTLGGPHVRHANLVQGILLLLPLHSGPNGYRMQRQSQDCPSRRTAGWLSTAHQRHGLPTTAGQALAMLLTGTSDSVYLIYG